MRTINTEYAVDRLKPCTLNRLVVPMSNPVPNLYNMGFLPESETEVLLNSLSVGNQSDS